MQPSEWVCSAPLQSRVCRDLHPLCLLLRPGLWFGGVCVCVRSPIFDAPADKALSCNNLMLSVLCLRRSFGLWPCARPRNSIGRDAPAINSGRAKMLAQEHTHRVLGWLRTRVNYFRGQHICPSGDLVRPGPLLYMLRSYVVVNTVL